MPITGKLSPERLAKLQAGREKYQAERRRQKEAMNGRTRESAAPTTTDNGAHTGRNATTGATDLQDRQRGASAAHRGFDENGSSEQRSATRSARGVSRRDEFPARDEYPDRANGVAVDRGDERIVTRDTQPEGITARLAAPVNAFVDTVLERVGNLGKSRDDEHDEDDEDDDDEREPGRMRQLYESWRDGNGGKMSAEEAERRRDDLMEKLIWYSAQADEFLTLSNGMGEEARIWRLQPDEAKPLANIWIRWAKQNVNAAVSMRAFMDGDDYLQAAVILGPRLLRTSAWYPRHGGFNLEKWQR